MKLLSLKFSFHVLTFATLFFSSPLTVLANKPSVTDVEMRCDANRLCTFEVSVLHADEGWDHYANKYEIRTPRGEIIGTRVLQHPHVDEQPFTRSLPDVKIPEGITELHVYAFDSVHGQSDQPYVVQVKTDEGLLSAHGHS